MRETTYIATVYGTGAMAKAHLTMREAFDWVKSCVNHGGWSYDRGRVVLGDTVLLEYTSQTTEWRHDGYARWENGV